MADTRSDPHGRAFTPHIHIRQDAGYITFQHVKIMTCTYMRWDMVNLCYVCLLLVLNIII